MPGSGGAPGIRDRGLRESALALPAASFGYVIDMKTERIRAVRFDNRRRVLDPEYVLRTQLERVLARIRQARADVAAALDKLGDGYTHSAQVRITVMEARAVGAAG